jgi:hypothetical protein
MHTVRHPVLLARQVGFSLLLAACVSACSGPRSTPGDAPLTATGLVSDTFTSTAFDLVDVVETPLHDFGIDQEPIPAVLQTIEANPYQFPTRQCEALRGEIAQLDGVLGPDADAPKVAHDFVGGKVVDGADMAHDAATGFVKGQLNIIPLRSVIRSFSGAKSHDQDMNAAMEAGKLRRAYLRGVAEAQFGERCSLHPAVTTVDAVPTTIKNPPPAAPG